MNRPQDGPVACPSPSRPGAPSEVHARTSTARADAGCEFVRLRTPRMSTTRIALVWSLAERYASVMLALIASMITARLLTPSEIGKFSLCAAAVAVAATMRDFGISEYIIQEKDLTARRLRAACGVSIAVAWCVGALIFALRYPIATFYAEPELVTLITILTLNFLILPFATPTFALLNREMAFKRLFAIQVTSTFLGSMTGIALAWRGSGAVSLAWGSVTATAVQAVMVSLVRPSVAFRPAFSGAAPVLRYGLLAVAGRVLDTISGNAHEFIIARLFGFTGVGLMSRAMGMNEMFSRNITQALTRVAMPAMAIDHRNDQSLVATYAQGTAAFTALAWPFAVFVSLAAPEIMRVLFGPQWDAAAGLASLLALTMLPNALYVLSAPTLAAMGQVERRLRISVFFFPIHVSGLLVAALIGGFAWMPAAFMVTHLLLLSLHTHHLCKATGASILALYRPTAASLAPTAAVALAVCGMLWACRTLEWTPILTLLAALCAGGLAWMLGIRTVGHPVLHEVLRLQRRPRDKGPA